jgi:hypothetical protein
LEIQSMFQFRLDSMHHQLSVLWPWRESRRCQIECSIAKW